MAERLLLMFSLIIVEIGAGIAGFLAVSSAYPYGVNEGGAAVCVTIAVGMAVSMLLTIAFFVRKSARAKVKRIVLEATSHAARILSDATDKALALNSLDAGRCVNCGNPRTGRFCPKCGRPAQAPTATVQVMAAPTPTPALAAPLSGASTVTAG